jgi:hypothetical protein
MQNVENRWCGRCLLTFQREMLPLSSGSIAASRASLAREVGTDTGRGRSLNRTSRSKKCERVEEQAGPWSCRQGRDRLEEKEVTGLIGDEGTVRRNINMKWKTQL